MGSKGNDHQHANMCVGEEGDGGVGGGGVGSKLARLVEMQLQARDIYHSPKQLVHWEQLKEEVHNQTLQQPFLKWAHLNKV